MTNADLLDRAIDEIIAGRSPDTAAYGADEVGLAVRAARLASAARAVPVSTGRADIRRHILTTALEAKPQRRLSRWIVLIPTTVLLLGGGIAVAARKAVPGDALYSVRRGISAMRLAVALGDHAKAVALLDRAVGTLSDAEHLASAGRQSKAQKALRVFAGDLASARAEIARIDAAGRGDLSSRADTLEARAKVVANSIESGTANDNHGPGNNDGNQPGESKSGPSDSGNGGKRGEDNSGPSGSSGGDERSGSSKHDSSGKKSSDGSGSSSEGHGSGGGHEGEHD
jgi:uncharacterized protein DUF5667